MSRGSVWDDLVESALGLVPSGGRAILGITGPPGAGKTTLAIALVDAVSAARPADDAYAVHVPMDGFHLADVQLDRLGLRRRKGAPETFDDAGYAALLERLSRRDEPVVYAPGFERALEQPIAASIAISREARLVVTEGNYLLHHESAWPRARRQLDAVWFCDLDEGLRVRRLIARHVAFGKTPAEGAEWVERSDEPNARLITATRPRADRFVDVDAALAGRVPDNGSASDSADSIDTVGGAS